VGLDVSEPPSLQLCSPGRAWGCRARTQDSHNPTRLPLQAAAATRRPHCAGASVPTAPGAAAAGAGQPTAAPQGPAVQCRCRSQHCGAPRRRRRQPAARRGYSGGGSERGGGRAARQGPVGRAARQIQARAGHLLLFRHLQHGQGGCRQAWRGLLGVGAALVRWVQRRPTAAHPAHPALPLSVPWPSSDHTRC
jgi:hypothetical protein